MGENELTSSQKLLRFAVVFFITIWALTFMAGCATYQPVDKCCETDVVYLEDINSGTTTFSTLDFNTITLDFKTGFYRHSDWYWGRTYGYWGNRPLWMDFGNYYSFYNPYYSFNRPWNHWDWYMRPWRPYQHNQWSWYNGPFNNQGYNVVYNSGRRGNTRSIKNKIGQASIIASTKPRINNTTPIIIKKHIEDKENHD